MKIFKSFNYFLYTIFLLSAASSSFCMRQDTNRSSSCSPKILKKRMKRTQSAPANLNFIENTEAKKELELKRKVYDTHYKIGQKLIKITRNANRPGVRCGQIHRDLESFFVEIGYNYQPHFTKEEIILANQCQISQLIGGSGYNCAIGEDLCVTNFEQAKSQITKPLAHRLVVQLLCARPKEVSEVCALMLRNSKVDTTLC